MLETLGSLHLGATESYVEQVMVLQQVRMAHYQRMQEKAAAVVTRDVE